ncbi:MAG: tryptophan--tRNA ligase [Candidatus Dojkabacteria bacterium]|nr:tryptophan--tRNA ligase [Candidatus Dojkabacteria bacterium]
MSTLNKINNITIEEEHKNKLNIKNQIDENNLSLVDGQSLKDISRIAKYMNGVHEYIDRGIIYAHLDFEPITTAIANKQPFTIVSGKNPSSSLHLGHLATFRMLLKFQELGGEIVIPLTSDESYIDGKVKNIKEAENIAYKIIAPQILAMGFDPQKTKILFHTQYADLYRISSTFGQYISINQLSSAFGINPSSTASQVFYRGAVQLSTILLPQLLEFGGNKNVLVPVSVDQHPYILLARDVAKKIGMIPPSEVVIPFLQSHKDPLIKMSSSKPDTCIYLTDTPDIVKNKLNKAYTGSVSTLDGHKRLGAIPEIDSCFQIIRYHHDSIDYINQIYSDYKNGSLKSSDLKEITIKFVNDMLKGIQERAKNVSDKEIQEVTLKMKINSI